MSSPTCLASVACLFTLCVFVAPTSAAVFYAYPDESCQDPDLSKHGESCDVGGKSFVQCVASLKEPGDECRLHAGRYPFRGTPLLVRGLHGTAEAPFIIAAVAGEESDVVLDGTMPVTSSLQNWEVHTFHSMIYCAPAQVEVWQLFADGQMQTNARWPNAFWHDFSVFNVSNWAHSANSSNSTAGIMVDDGSHDHGFVFDSADILGAVAVLNTGSWNTYPALVLSHEQGSHKFTYDATGQYHDTAQLNRYFLEDKFDFLDSPSEWFYDKNENKTCFIALDGAAPSTKHIVGKVSTYALNITNTSYLTIANLTFFATTIWASSIAERPQPTFIDHLTISSVNFSYPSYSRRMLQDVGRPMWTLISSRFYKPDTQDIMGRPLLYNEDDDDLMAYDTAGDDRDHGFHTIFNCSWTYTDGPALDIHGKSNKLINNHFSYNDWSAADEIRANGGLATINTNFGFGDYFFRNTLRNNGASSGYRPAPNSTIQYNDIMGQCWGDIQHDGAGMQVMSNAQVGTTVSHNWVHNSVKYGIRFDGQPPRTGNNGTMFSNVAWKCGGLLVKGDYHTVLHNMAFDLRKETPEQVEGQACSMCVYGYVRTNPVAINMHTVTANNAADAINGGTGNGGHSKEKNVEPLPGYARDNIQASIRDEVLDADNHDFRPRKNTTFGKYGGVGPYPPLPNRTTSYWIPGRQLSKASTPVPPSGSLTVQADRDSVMWLAGIDTHTSQVNFLTSCSSAHSQQATSLPKLSAEGRQQMLVGSRHFTKDGILWASGTLPATQNVYYLPAVLKPKQRYCWQVDTVTATGDVVTGDVWTFTTQ